jgi:hypothetical protein
LRGCVIMKDTTRPIILLEKTADSEIERFQNQTLRPILKLQNELLISFFQNQLLEKKINWEKSEEIKRREIIHSILKKEISFRSLIIGLVCGHFTREEAGFYFQHKSEATRRIVTMLIERLISQV